MNRVVVPGFACYPLEHDAEKWVPVFGKTSCSSKKLERDGDSKKSHHALMVARETEQPLTRVVARVRA
jgi:hypothetical protein